MRKTLKQLVVLALAQAKRPLQNHEIRSIIERKRPTTTPESIDSTLNLASKKGDIDKTPTTGNGRSKFVYSVQKAPSVAKVIKSVLTGSKIDSLEIALAVRSVLPEVTKQAVDTALWTLSKNGKISKSKNPMTDSNTISSQSKFLYSTK